MRNPVTTRRSCCPAPTTPAGSLDAHAHFIRARTNGECQTPSHALRAGTDAWTRAPCVSLPSPPDPAAATTGRHRRPQAHQPLHRAPRPLRPRRPTCHLDEPRRPIPSTAGERGARQRSAPPRATPHPRRHVASTRHRRQHRRRQDPEQPVAPAACGTRRDHGGPRPHPRDHRSARPSAAGDPRRGLPRPVDGRRRQRRPRLLRRPTRRPPAQRRHPRLHPPQPPPVHGPRQRHPLLYLRTAAEPGPRCSGADRPRPLHRVPSRPAPWQARPRARPHGGVPPRPGRPIRPHPSQPARTAHAEHFETLAGGALQLADDGRKALLAAWQEWKTQPWEHPLAGRDVPAGLLPVVQARILGRHIRGDLPGYLSWTAS